MKIIKFLTMMKPIQKDKFQPLKKIRPLKQWTVGLSTNEVKIENIIIINIKKFVLL